MFLEYTNAGFYMQEYEYKYINFLEQQLNFQHVRSALDTINTPEF